MIPELNAYRPPLEARGLLDGLRISTVARMELQTNEVLIEDARNFSGFAANVILGVVMDLYPEGTEVN